MPTTVEASLRLVPARVDTVALSIPMVDADHTGATVSIVKAGTPDEQRTYRRKLDRGGFVAWGRGSTAWVEASLPKRGGLDNLEGVTVDEAWERIADLYDDAARFVEFRKAGQPSVPLSHGMSDVRGRAGTFEEAKVVRLDLVRDFDGVEQAPFILDGLAGVPVAGRSKVRRYADAERQQAQTLTVGPKAAWRATLYDKHAETLGQPVEAPEGRLRYEVRMRTDLLTGKWAQAHGGGVAQVLDLEGERLARLARGMFERVGFDREVDALGRLADVVFSHEALSPAERRNLWCYLTAPQHGGRMGFSVPTERKYRRQAEALGLVLAPVGSAPTSVRVRLDYDSGTEVTEAA